MGGVVLDSSDTTVSDIIQLQKQGKRLVVVHGGGNTVTEWLARQGVATRFVHGERVTDKPTLDIAVAVLAGLANKQFVAVLNGAGARAVGISGVDGGLVQARVKNLEMGHVGAVVTVDVRLLDTLLTAGFIPIVSPISLGLEAIEGAPPLLNVNGDPVAGEIAAALGAERLIFLTDVPGLLDKQGRVMAHLSANEAEILIASGVASGGMIPKIRACIRALSATSSARIIDGRQPHALLNEIEGKGAGTTIFKDRK